MNVMRTWAGRQSSGFAKVLLAAIAVLQLGACVSTDELYAEYDSENCKFIVRELRGQTLLHEAMSDTHFTWEPAVYFGFDEDHLTDEHLQALDHTMQVLKRFPKMMLGLQGFTDKFGSAKYNLALAERRIDSVQRYIISKGIEPSRILRQPFGESLQQFGLRDRKARANIRRVELMLLDEFGKPMTLHYAFEGL